MALTAPTITGYSPFWQATGDRTAWSMSQAQGRAKGAWRIAKLMDKTGMRDAKAALAVLIGAAPGATATNTWTYVANPSSTSTTVPGVTSLGELGGNRVIATQTAINRATTAADVTELKRWFATALLEKGATYPTRLGSGGGSMIKGGMSGFM